MPSFHPDRLAAWTNGRWTLPPAELILGFNPDTRTLQPGQMFVALRTDKRDGHEFLAVAAEAGAAGALVSRADDALDFPQLVVGDPLDALQTIARLHRVSGGTKVIGVTGSAGKTSTKNLLALLLGEPPTVLATEGNLNNHLGVPLTLTRLEAGVTRYAVVEAGINMPGEMRGLAAMIQPDCAVVTLVAPAHLERLGSIATVAYEKSELLRWLRPGGLAVVPWTAWCHPPLQYLAAEVCVAVPAGCDVPAHLPRTYFDRFAVEHAIDRTAVTLGAGGAERTFRFRRVSDGMAQNAALSLLLASALGVSDDQLRERIAQWRPASLRGELRALGGQLVFLDCYNANPASMADALVIFQQTAPAGLRRFYVLGGMDELGAAAADFHRQLGASLRLRDGDAAGAIGPHAGAVGEGLLAAGNAPAQVRVATHLDEVRRWLGDFQGAVFVKGSRRYQLENLFADEPALRPEP